MEYVIFSSPQTIFNIIIFILGDTSAYKHSMQQGTTRNNKCVFESWTANAWMSDMGKGLS
jgi:hypothetical protein